VMCPRRRGGLELPTGQRPPPAACAPVHARPDRGAPAGRTWGKDLLADACTGSCVDVQPSVT
jgi:hypothetical protein